ncbi:MAG: glycosyl transferase family 1, partial [Roseiflexaceae bacterium]|nr:glycosyl transferase family 1 [Roseiflexaceae bacterium]
QLTPPAQELPGKARNFVLDRIVWPMLAPLIARQRDHNAAVIRAAYAAAEYQDHLSNDLTRIIAAVRLLSRQTRDIAEQIAALHEADQHLRAALHGDSPPPPRTIPPTAVIDGLDSDGAAR